MASRRLFSSLYRSPSTFPISNPNPRLSRPLPHRPSPFGYHHLTDAAQLNTASRITANSEVSALLGRIPSAVRYHPTVATDLGWLQVSIRTFKTNSITSVQATNVPSCQRIVSSRIKVADLLNPYQRGTIGLFRRDGAGKNCAYYASQPGGSGSGGFKKQRKGRMHGIACTGNRVRFGRYALQVLEPAWISARQIEAGRRAMTRHARGGGKIWVRVIPDKPVSEKPTEVRMGKGKGAVSYYVAVVKPGRVLYEVGGVAENVARKAITMAGSKMPVKTKFIVADGNVETKGSLDKRKAKRLIMEESLKRLQE